MKQDSFSSQIDMENLTTREQQALARRKQIVETALTLFAQQGFDRTSTRQIAQEANIAEGLIFHYFRSKEELLTAVLETQHSYKGEMQELLKASKGRTAMEVLRQIATEVLARFRRESEVTLLIFSTAQINPVVWQALRKMIFEESLPGMAAFLRSRIAAGELRADLAIENSAMMFMSSLIIFFFLNHPLSDEEWAQRADQYVSEILATWMKGAEG